MKQQTIMVPFDAETREALRASIERPVPVTPIGACALSEMEAHDFFVEHMSWAGTD